MSDACYTILENILYFCKYRVTNHLHIMLRKIRVGLALLFIVGITLLFLTGVF